MLRILTGLFLCSLMNLSGCKLSSPSPDEEREAIRKLYENHLKAVNLGDSFSIKEGFSSKVRAGLESDETLQKMRLTQKLYPKNSSIKQIKILGDETAKITAIGHTETGRAEANFDVIKEEGSWRIDKLEWNIIVPKKETDEPSSSQNPAK